MRKLAACLLLLLFAAYQATAACGSGSCFPRSSLNSGNLTINNTAYYNVSNYYTDLGVLWYNDSGTIYSNDTTGPNGVNVTSGDLFLGGNLNDGAGTACSVATACAGGGGGSEVYNGTFNETEGVYVYNSTPYRVDFNATLLNLTIDSRAGATTPGGGNKSVQFNYNNAFGGSSGLEWHNESNTLVVTGPGTFGTHFTVNGSNGNTSFSGNNIYMTRPGANYLTASDALGSLYFGAGGMTGVLSLLTGSATNTMRLNGHGVGIFDTAAEYELTVDGAIVASENVSSPLLNTSCIVLAGTQVCNWTAVNGSIGAGNDTYWYENLNWMKNNLTTAPSGVNITGDFEINAIGTYAKVLEVNTSKKNDTLKITANATLVGDLNMPYNASFLCLRTTNCTEPFTVRGPFKVEGDYHERITLEPVTALGIDPPNMCFRSGLLTTYRDLCMDAVTGNWRFFSEPHYGKYGYLIANLWGGDAVLPTNRVIFEFADGGVYGGGTGLGTDWNRTATDRALTFYAGGINSERMRLFGRGELDIGTTTPTGNNLTVNGNASISGNLSTQNLSISGMLCFGATCISKPPVIATNNTAFIYANDSSVGLNTTNTGVNALSFNKSNGILRFPYQSNVRAYNSSATAVACAASIPCIFAFDTESWDIQSEFRNSRFTAREGGIYAVDFKVTFAAAGQTQMANLTKNGVTYSTSRSEDRRATLALADTVQLNAGDYLELWTIATAASTFYGGSENASISIWKVA